MQKGGISICAFDVPSLNCINKNLPFYDTIEVQQVTQTSPRNPRDWGRVTLPDVTRRIYEFQCNLVISYFPRLSTSSTQYYFHHCSSSSHFQRIDDWPLIMNPPHIKKTTMKSTRSTCSTRPVTYISSTSTEEGISILQFCNFRKQEIRRYPLSPVGTASTTSNSKGEPVRSNSPSRKVFFSTDRAFCFLEWLAC